MESDQAAAGEGFEGGVARAVFNEMRISFDIDETLVCRREGVPTESGWGASAARYFFDDPLRLGTRRLFKKLRQLGCDVWIYTTSLRTEQRTRTWLWLHDLAIDGYVNATVHNKTAHSIRTSPAPSKYPPTFGIELHVDDLEGVRMEGERHGFHVLVVRPDDLDWAKKVLDAVHEHR